jgi:hypothetical protein
VKIADQCTPWKIASGAESLVLQALQFYLNLVKVKAMVRPAVSRPVYLVIRDPFGTRVQFFFFFFL